MLDFCTIVDGQNGSLVTVNSNLPSTYMFSFRLLLKDMKKLWEEGFRMWDEYRKDYFTLRSIIFVTTMTILHYLP